MYKFLCEHVSNSLEYIRRSRIAESYGNSMLNVLKNCQTVFDIGCMILHSPGHQHVTGQWLKVLSIPQQGGRLMAYAGTVVRGQLTLGKLHKALFSWNYSGREEPCYPRTLAGMLPKVSSSYM